MYKQLDVFFKITTLIVWNILKQTQKVIECKTECGCYVTATPESFLNVKNLLYPINQKGRHEMA